MGQSKYHHRIPKTYMKPWCGNSDSVWYYSKKSGVLELRNISNIMGVRHFHSIKAGAIFTTQEALNKIFAPLSGYKVYEKTDDGKELLLSSYDEMNKRYHNYDKWIIKGPDGLKIKTKQKKIIKSQIDDISDNSIEEAWNKKYENKWNVIISEIQNSIIDIYDKKSVILTDEVYHTIIDYFVMFQWRSNNGYNKLREVFDWFISLMPDIMQVEVENPVHRKDKTVADEMWHNYLLSQYHAFLNDEGVMELETEQYYEKLAPLFLIDRNNGIITSDNPCFTFINKDGYQEPILVALPGLVISLARRNSESPNEYRIYEMSPDDVDYYNRVIFENGNEIISKEKLNIKWLEDIRGI